MASWVSVPTSYTVAHYVADLRAIRGTGAATAETSFYPPVDRLFNAVGQSLTPRVLFSTQIRNQGAGMPDGGLFPQPGRSPRNVEPPLLRNPERGVVEIKPAGYDLGTLAESEQTIRYLRQYGTVLITNLHEFRLLTVQPDGQTRTLQRYKLAATADDLWYRSIDAKHDQLLPDFLKRVMLYKVPLTQPKEVAWLLASYAREARARAEDHDLPAFHSVKVALEESLGIQFEGEKGEHFFRSTLVQTLFYGIFSAWVLWRHSPDGRLPHAVFNWKLADDYLKVPVLRKLFREVSDRHHLNTIQLTEILELAGEALNCVEASLFDIFQGEKAVAYFYEPFLEAFDPQLRKELGVWYTPREIVQYMVERVDHLLRTELNQPDGLASPAVRILDPCCGTGAYLTAVLDRIHRTLLQKAGDDTALVPSQLRTAALERIFGFEIMPAPFVIAHMEIARLLEEARAPLNDEQRAGIFLTNALTGWIPATHPKSIFVEMEQEREAAEDIKQNGTILVILGNPPYNGYAGIALGEERNLTTAYRAAITGLPAPQGQGLNDLYIRFFRIAEHRIAANRDGQGIVSFISNSAWLDGLSHTTMRHHYLHAFSQIWIDNLNGDKYRTGKTTPEGRPDPSAFSTDGLCCGREWRWRWGTTKLAQLLTESRREATATYVPLTTIPALGNPFAYRVHSTDYTSWPRLPELFPVSFPGIKTSRDPLVVDIDRDKLEVRMKSYFSKEISDTAMSQLVPSAMERGARFDPIHTRRILQEKGFRPWQVMRHCYRPYDLRWLYWEPETELLDRKREDYVSRFVQHFTFVVPQRMRTGYDPPQVTSNLLDLNAADGGGLCFPVVELERPMIGMHPELHRNATAACLLITEKLQAHAEDPAFHALAIMHTPQYRTENAGALLGDWPRVPLPATAELLAQSATLGRRLADLLDAESSINLSAEWSFLAKLQLPQNFPIEEALKLTAGWGSRGQGSTVMPGRGLVKVRDWTTTERDRLTALAAAQGLTLDEALAILGASCLDIHLNGAAYWTGVPANVWTYTLGGYQVLKKWLSYRELPLLGRPLKTEEAAWFAQVVRRITAILLLGPSLDRSYQAILPTATGLPAVH